MKYEETIKVISKVLEQMGAVDIAFQDTKKNNLIIAVFNCKEVTSFIADITGWVYTGIQLDPTGGHQYKIDFTKTS